MRRARKVHGAREAVVDGSRRFTYEQFCDRCDAWAAALASLGVAKGDRVATIAPNTHQHLEQFYAVPRRGAVIVPMNYRLAADDFVYMANHCGATVLCVHGDYLALIDSVRARMPGVRHFVALEGRRSGWLEYESLVAECSALEADREQLTKIELQALAQSRELETAKNALDAERTQIPVQSG